MRISFALPTLLLSATLFGSCWADCVTGSGNVVRRSMTTTDYHGIQLKGALDVQVTQGSTPSIAVEGQSNLVELVTTTVKDGMLVISTSQCYRTDKPFVVHITTPTITRVVVQGSGDVTCSGTFVMEDLEVSVMGSGDVELTCSATRVDMSVQGSGDVKMKGRAITCTATVTGRGDVKAGDLVCERAVATVTGSGDVSVHATQAVKAAVTGSGSVKYRGAPPQVDSDVTGSGDIIAQP